MNMTRPSQPLCRGCGQSINGYYLSALGAAWHPEHFVCATCHQPINNTQFSVRQATPYHTQCYRDRFDLRCVYCHKPITAQYYTHNGASYHLECYQEHIGPRCQYCHKPILGQYYTHEGAFYHSECYRDHVVPRCAYCGKPLMGEYLVDHWGTKYCKEHQSQYPSCLFCGRLVPPQQQELHSGDNQVVRCPICRASAVDTIEQAQPLFRKLIQWVNSQGLMYNNLHLSLELCDRAKLAVLLQSRAEQHSLGVTSSSTYTQNGQVMHTQVDGIAVLRGMPSTLFQGVTIHELG